MDCCLLFLKWTKPCVSASDPNSEVLQLGHSSEGFTTTRQNQNVTFDLAEPPRQQSISPTKEGSPKDISLATPPLGTIANSKQILLKHPIPSSPSIESFGPSRRVDTFSPKFGTDVKIIVVTKFRTHKQRDIVNLPRQSTTEKTYRYIQSLSKSIGERYWDDQDQSRELSLLQGSCLIACGGRNRCSWHLESQRLESQEEWNEIETLVENYEKGPCRHGDLRILITRKLELTKKPVIMTTTNDVRKWLWAKLDECQVPSGVERKLHYLPKGELEALTQEEYVRSVVEESSSEFSGSKGIEELASTIYRKAPILFSIFVYCRIPFGLLESMMDNGIYDSSLPLPDLPVWRKGIESDYDKIYCKSLWKEQWIFKAVEFNVRGAHQILHASSIIPFLHKEEFARGNFSIVYKVKIHQSHQRVYSLLNDPNPELALKAIDSHKSTAQAAFRNERFVVRELQNLTHPNIIKLLGTYEQEGVYHFLFPLAECSLEALMKRDPEYFTHPNSSRSKKMYTAWIIEQFAGIASGLAKIHVKDSTPKDRPVLLDPSTTIGRERPEGTGYHHDIKPPNLLLFREVDDIEDVGPHGILQIADFGIGKFHSKQSGSGTKTFRGTETYAAPETIIPREAGQQLLKLSRPYDVWSLGCVLMEVLVWNVLGTLGWEEFNRKRLGLVEEDGAFESDGFFFITNTKPKVAKVRDEVKVWMENLRKHQLLANEEGCLARLLNLIEERVLDVDPSTRIRAEPLKEELRKFSEIARSEVGESIGDVDGEEDCESESSKSRTPSVVIHEPDAGPSNSRLVSRPHPSQHFTQAGLGGKARFQTSAVDKSRYPNTPLGSLPQSPTSLRDSFPLHTSRPPSSPKPGQFPHPATSKSLGSISSMAVQPTRSRGS